MDFTQTYNPYDFANPISNANLLVGREAEMDEIKYYLDNAKYAPRPINIALLGPRASGKTSILNVTEIEARDRGFCVVRINFDEDDAKNQLMFFFKVFDSLLSEACQVGAFGGSYGKTYDTYLDEVVSCLIPEDKTFSPFLFPIQYAKAMSSNNLNAQVSDHSFRKDLIKIREEVDKPIILLFDEGNVLVQSRVLLQKLRNIFMNTLGFMLIMTGTPDLFPVMDEVFSPIVRQFKKININEFKNTDETRACITKPLESLGVKVNEVFDQETYRNVSDIHNLSGGRPYEIQLICHMLFRRLQSKRAEKMKLDFSVLEEVRRELETWQDIASRPILTMVRTLKKSELSTLSILCSCNGNATFEQLWAIEYIFNKELSQTEDEFRNIYQLCLDKGILKVDNNLISFAGDDFDQIYTKYFAREQDIMIGFPTSTTLEHKWQMALDRFIVEDFPIPIQLINSFPSMYSFESLSNMILELTNQTQGTDTSLHNSSPFLNLYQLMLWYQKQRVLPLIIISSVLPWLNIEMFYSALEPTDLDILAEATSCLKELSVRIATVGGMLTIEDANLPIVPLNTLIHSAKKLNSRYIRISLSTIHGRYLLKIYNRQNREEALFHAKLAYEYYQDQRARIANDIGYVFLGTGEYEKAELLLKKSIITSQSGRLPFPDLPIYNLGILQAKCGQLIDALARFRSCIALINESSQEKERHVMWLWVPTVIDHTLLFEEYHDVDLLEMARKAEAAIEQMLLAKNG